MEFYLGFCIVDYDTKQRIKPLANNSSQVRSKPSGSGMDLSAVFAFQSLIGKIKTKAMIEKFERSGQFQSLIGKIKTKIQDIS